MEPWQRPWWPLIVLACLLVACTSPAATPSPVTLRVVLADDWADTRAVADVLAAFEADHAGAVRVQLHGVPFSQVPELVLASQELGQHLDLVQWHAFAAGAAGWAQPIDDLWGAAELDTVGFLPGALEQVTWDGRRYGVPLDANALALLVNVDALRQAGLDPEVLATPEGFRTAATAVVTSGASDHALTVSASTWVTYGWIRSLGGRLLDPDADPQDPRFTFDDPATIAALTLLADLVREGQAPRPFAMAVAGDALGAFAAGEVAMHAGGSWDLGFRRRAVGSVVDEVRVVPLPQADPATPRTVLGGSSLLLPTDASHRDLAFELLLRLTADDVALQLAHTEGRLPTRTALLADPSLTADPLLAVYLTQLPHAEVMPLIAYPAAEAVFREGIEAILAGRLTPAEAMAAAQRSVETGS